MTASVEQQMAAPVATVPGGGGAGLLDPLWRSGGGRGWERGRGGWRCYGTGREGVVLCGGRVGGWSRVEEESGLGRVGLI